MPLIHIKIGLTKNCYIPAGAMSSSEVGASSVLSRHDCLLVSCEAMCSPCYDQDGKECL